jgi:hypothetical protein
MANLSWMDEVDGLFSTVHLYNLCIQVYLDPIDLGWHFSCIELSLKHRSLPKRIDSLSLAKKETIIRIKERLLFLAEESLLIK